MEEAYVVMSNPPETGASYIIGDKAYKNKETAEERAETTSFGSVVELELVEQ